MNYQQQLLDRLNNRSARVSVIGLGYVGLPLAVEFAEAGFTVVGLDVAAGKRKGSWPRKPIHPPMAIKRNRPAAIQTVRLCEDVLRLSPNIATGGDVRSSPKATLFNARESSVAPSPKRVPSGR